MYENEKSLEIDDGKETGLGQRIFKALNLESDVNKNAALNKIFMELYHSMNPPSCGKKTLIAIAIGALSIANCLNYLGPTTAYAGSPDALVITNNLYINNIGMLWSCFAAAYVGLNALKTHYGLTDYQVSDELKALLKTPETGSAYWIKLAMTFLMSALSAVPFVLVYFSVTKDPKVPDDLLAVVNFIGITSMHMLPFEFVNSIESYQYFNPLFYLIWLISYLKSCLKPSSEQSEDMENDEFLHNDKWEYFKNFVIPSSNIHAQQTTYVDDYVIPGIGSLLLNTASIGYYANTFSSIFSATEQYNSQALSWFLTVPPVYAMAVLFHFFGASTANNMIGLLKDGKSILAGTQKLTLLEKDWIYQSIYIPLAIFNTFCSLFAYDVPHYLINQFLNLHQSQAGREILTAICLPMYVFLCLSTGNMLISDIAEFFSATCANRQERASLLNNDGSDENKLALYIDDPTFMKTLKKIDFEKIKKEANISNDN